MCSPGDFLQQFRRCLCCWYNQIQLPDGSNPQIEPFIELAGSIQSNGNGNGNGKSFSTGKKALFGRQNTPAREPNALLCNP